MSLQETPSAERLHIGFFGKRNSGKSSLLNVFVGQQVSITSGEAGTTTDAVNKSMEISGLGACVLTDTAGFDDTGALGEARVEKTKEAAEKADIAVLLCAEGGLEQEKQWYEYFEENDTPVILVVSKADLLAKAQGLQREVKETFGLEPVMVSAKTMTGIEELRGRMLQALPKSDNAGRITGGLAEEGDSVLLVMPQDIQAPKGRLILPQVQTIRELLDKKCIIVSVTEDKLSQALAAMKNPPRLIITDSQVFGRVYEKKPAESMLTSFSVLFAAYKGDIQYYLEGAERMESLTENSKILIAECCTHVPLTEDIGRVKLPRLLRKRFGEKMEIRTVGGRDFPEDLRRYDLIIQCGGCMFNRKYILSRIRKAKAEQVPMTNYGVAIAWLTGILDKVSIPVQAG